MEIKILYEDDELMAVDKPAGMVVFPEGQTKETTLIDMLIREYPKLKEVGEAPRYGVAHRLDKDTSGVLLIAKSTEALIFIQKQFKKRTIEKKYLALAVGVIKEDQGEIATLIGRSPKDPRKQKAYPLGEKDTPGKREAITKYWVLERFEQYTFLEVQIATGRKHQIRCHLSHIHHPIAGDALYGFKDSPKPIGLERQFLHAGYVKIQLPNGSVQEIFSELPRDLQTIISNLPRYE